MPDGPCAGANRPWACGRPLRTRIVEASRSMASRRLGRLCGTRNRTVRAASDGASRCARRTSRRARRWPEDRRDRRSHLLPPGEAPPWSAPQPARSHQRLRGAARIVQRCVVRGSSPIIASGSSPCGIRAISAEATSGKDGGGRPAKAAKRSARIRARRPAPCPADGPAGAWALLQREAPGKAPRRLAELRPPPRLMRGQRRRVGAARTWPRAASPSPRRSNRRRASDTAPVAISSRVAASSVAIGMQSVGGGGRGQVASGLVRRDGVDPSRESGSRGP